MSKNMTVRFWRLLNERLVALRDVIPQANIPRRRLSTSTSEQPVEKSKTIRQSPSHSSLQSNVTQDVKHIETVKPGDQSRLAKTVDQSRVILAVESKINPAAEYYRRELPRTCISFCSEEGKVIFAEALKTGHMDSYFQLASQFMTQDEPAYCGLSTLVMVLNALEVDPNRVWKAPWRWYNEKMLDCCVPLSVVRNLGLTLDQFACLAACNTLSVLVQRTDSTSSEHEFRALVESVTRRTDRVVVASYSREALNQTGDGHFSSVGGYHPARDLVLMMDTARFKYPPHWVPLTLLYTAMQKIDMDTGLPRGYLQLSKSRMPSSLLFHLSTLISPINVDEKTSSNVIVFIQSWESYLLQKSSSSSTNEAFSVVAQALTLLTELTALLEDNTAILTTRVDGTYARDESNRYTENLRSLIDSIEASSLYDGGSRIVKPTPPISGGIVGKIGTDFNISPSEVGGANQGEAIRNTIPSNDGAKPISTELDRQLGRLNQVHFATMFLLSWPYHRCGGRNNAAVLRDVVVAVLKLGDSELLDKETGCLRQQLSSILAYVKRHSKPS